MEGEKRERGDLAKTVNSKSRRMSVSITKYRFVQSLSVYSLVSCVAISFIELIS